MLALCELGFLRAAVSQLVLVEAERHVLAGFGPAATAQFDLIQRQVPMDVLPVPADAELHALVGTVTSKGLHVLASALAVGAPFLISLDKAFVSQVNRTGLPIWRFRQATLSGVS